MKIFLILLIFFITSCVNPNINTNETGFGTLAIGSDEGSTGSIFPNELSLINLPEIFGIDCSKLLQNQLYENWDY